MLCRFVYCGEENLTVTSFPDTLVPVIGRPAVLTSAYFFSRPKLKATSAGVIAEPSDHLTPVRTLKVIDLPPFPHVYPEARK